MVEVKEVGGIEELMTIVVARVEDYLQRESQWLEDGTISRFED